MRKAAAGLALGFGAALVVLLAGAAGALEPAELQTYDWRMRRTADPAAVRSDIVLVEINDLSIRELEPALGRVPWPRLAHAMIIDFLRRGGAKVIAVDVTFPERDTATRMIMGHELRGAESDQLLVDAARRAGNVILLADAVDPGVVDEAANAVHPWRDPGYRLGPAIEQRPLIVPPFRELTEAGAGIAHNFMALDDDGPARRVPPFVRQGDRFVATLGVAAAIAAEKIPPGGVTLEGKVLRIGDRRVPLVGQPVRHRADQDTFREQLSMLIPYKASALVGGRRPYRSYEARQLIASEDLMNAGEKPLIDPAVFKDAIVFVGFTASGLVDVFPTPFGSQGTMPGIQLHASVADAVLSNRFIEPSPAWVRAVATITGAVVVGLMAVFLPYSAGAIASIALLGLWTWISVATFRGGTWLDMSQPLIGVTTALFAGTAYRYFVEDREKRKVSRLFGRYVSKDVYHQLVNNPSLAVLGGARRDMSVLFSDIRGFTTVSERGNPEELVAQLNEYFSRMVEIVFKHKGTVDKFVGDMVMALFGAPVADPAHAEHAVAAAVEMVRELGELNRKWIAEGKVPLDIGIGVNSGEMIAGNIGSSSIMSYTVIGDNVNLGARLESLNKDYGCRIIISDATRVRLTSQYDIHPLGGVVVKGKTRPVAIHEICVPAPVPAEVGQKL